MHWIRDLTGDYINLDTANCIRVTTASSSYVFKDHCCVVVETPYETAYLWAERITSNDGKEVEKLVERANLFMEALVQRINAE